MGAEIRRLRGELSQAEFARLMGVSQAGVSLWESGGVDFGYDQVCGIEEALGVPAGTLARLAGYVDANGSTGPFTVPVETVDDVIEALRAASVLGLHVAAANRFGRSADEPAEEWLVVVGGDDDDDLDQ
jgi:transcriptional regulator with XRE-family HTH domain